MLYKECNVAERRDHQAKMLKKDLLMRLMLGGVIAGLFLTVAGLSAAAERDFPPVDKLPSHPALPDPLVMFDGTPVTTPEQWFNKRRPEIQALFEYYEYGIAPPAPKNVVGKVERH